MNLRSWIGCCASMTLLAASLAGSASGEPAAGAVPCPDLSGTYLYPGLEGLDSICKRQWEGRRDLPIPGPGGFFISGAFRHPFELRQSGCDELTLSFRYNTDPFGHPPAGEDVPHATTLDLRPSSQRKVSWQDGALTWSSRFTPQGFRWPPWRTDSMTLRLQKLPDGSLTYALRHEGPKGKVLGEIECALPPWPAEP